MLFLYIWLLMAVLMTKGTAANDITDYFSLLDRANAECDDNQITQMGQYIDDCFDLISSFNSAIEAALKNGNGEDEKAYQDGVVARRLFTVWFGIQFGGTILEDPKPTSDTKAIWDTMYNSFSAVYDVLETETVVGPGLTNTKPFLSCSGEYAQKYSWADQAYSNDGYLIPGNSIADIYGEKDLREPWWIDEVAMYFFGLEEMSDNCCDGYTSADGSYDQIYAQVLGGEDSGVRKTASGELIYAAEKKPGLLMCPRVFEDEVNILSDVDWEDPSFQTQIDEMWPLGSMSMLHELFHLSTYWSQTTDAAGNPEYSVNPDLVIDVTYDPYKALQLARGVLASSDKAFYDPVYAAKNAQTYAFFAFSYWYYEQSWEGNTPATFYPGYLVVWDDLFTQ